MTSASAALGVELLAPVSVGELIDKITILRIKADRIEDDVKHANVVRELQALEDVRRRQGLEGFTALEDELRQVNEVLWDVEDELRRLEAAQCFEAGFIELARRVYLTNDRRAALKKAINLQAGSVLVEEKSYAGA